MLIIVFAVNLKWLPAGGAMTVGNYAKLTGGEFGNICERWAPGRFTDSVSGTRCTEVVDTYDRT